MSSDSDDALHWDGDDAEHVEAPAPRSPRSKVPRPAAEAPETASASTAADPASDRPQEPEDAPAVGNVALIGYGVIGGVYLLFAVGWIAGGLRLRPRASLLVADGLYFPWMWLAALAPVLWFAAAWALTRGKAQWIRVVAMVAGAVLLVPWPFVMFGAVGA